MRGKTIFILLLLFTSLVGCTENTAKEIEQEHKQRDLQKGLKVYSPEEQQKAEEENKVEEELLNKIEIWNPLSNEVVTSFLPIELGFGMDDEQYDREMKEWIKGLARGTETTPGYDQRMIPDRIGENGEIIKGSPRLILDEKSLLEMIVDLSSTGGKIDLPLTVTESGYEGEEAFHLDEVVIASYTTSFNSSISGRSKNIERSAAALNNVIIGAGDFFSFNTTVGPRDVENGYEKALEIVNGKLVEGIGGGVCQVSSTLFNAVDQVGVTYVEWHHHSIAVGYVPTGRDATVSYGGLDFRFQNITEIPFLLRAIVNDGRLTVELRTSKGNQEKFLAQG